METRCITPYCKNKTRRSRKICTTCEKRAWRAKYPMKAAYEALVQNAKRRKIFCDLTFEQFEKFCIETDYIAGKGRTKLSYSIDRIVDGPLPGYTITNIRILTVSDNSVKARNRQKMLAYDYRTGQAKVI